MDPSLYRAAMEGEIDVLKQNKGQLDIQVTPNKNTVLHIAAQFGQSQCVREILKMNPSLLCRANAKGDTALHVAARERSSDVVEALIERAKELDEDPETGFKLTKMLIRKTNEDTDTALHDALRNNHLDHRVELMIEEDPEIARTVNSAGETPLYLAAENGYDKMMGKILQTCTLAAYSGPGGRTALHVAVIRDSTESTEKLLNWKKDLAKIPDVYGWTPLHYAARFGHVLRAKQLLELDKSIAYITADEDDKKTALHVAASQGHVGVMEELISQCPDCGEMVNGKGKNILHVAVENEKQKVIKFVLKNSSLSSLLNQKDVHGNTPLHLLVLTGKVDGSTPLYLVAATGNFAYDLIQDPRVNKNAFNKGNLTPLDVIAYSDVYRSAEDLKIERQLEDVGGVLGFRNAISQDNDVLKNKKRAAEAKRMIPKDIRKTGDTHLIVAVLISTITFAAGFTMPGGYDGNDGPNQGMAILTRKAAFRAFVVTDTVAMISSTCAVLIYFASTNYEDQGKLEMHYELAARLILLAAVAMMLAFMTGMYAVLAHSSKFAVLVCVTGCLCFLYYSIRMSSINNEPPLQVSGFLSIHLPMSAARLH